MDNIEQKAMELMSEVTAERNGEVSNYFDAMTALCRAIERHEAFKEEVEDALLEFRQEVSNEILEYSKWCQSVGLQFPLLLERFIIPEAKPDPLEKLLQSIAITLDANDLREALDEAGLEIREKSK